MSNDRESDLARARELVRTLEGQMPDRMPAPPNDQFGESFDRHLMEGQRRRDGRDIHLFPTHLRAWFDALSEDDTKRLSKLMDLRPETVAWIEGKNTRELERLDGAVEFISSTRTAAKVLMYVSGVAVAFVGGVVALAKNGFDAFALLRGGIGK